jgi:hypothetical protein
MRELLIGLRAEPMKSGADEEGSGEAPREGLLEGSRGGGQGGSPKRRACAGRCEASGRGRGGVVKRGASEQRSEALDEGRGGTDLVELVGGELAFEGRGKAVGELAAPGLDDGDALVGDGEDGAAAVRRIW